MPVQACVTGATNVVCTAATDGNVEKALLGSVVAGAVQCNVQAPAGATITEQIACKSLPGVCAAVATNTDPRGAVAAAALGTLASEAVNKARAGEKVPHSATEEPASHKPAPVKQQPATVCSHLCFLCA